jgi:fucose 4-O-acetylase-like acetyltransferase
MQAFRISADSWIAKSLNLSILRKTRFTWVDYLRGIAIILVVYHHVRVGIERNGIAVSPVLVYSNMIFYSLRMPLFFLLSGIFINRSLANKSVSQLVATKFEKLFYPYIIWSVIQITIQIALSKSSHTSRGLIDFTYIFYQPRRLDQFWYLPALFNASMVYLFIKTKLKPGVWLNLLIALVFYFFYGFVNEISMMSDWMRFYIFFAIGASVSEIFFTESVQKKLNYKYSILLILPFFILSQIYYLTHNLGQEVYNAVYVQPLQDGYLAYVWKISRFLVIALIGCVTMFLLAFRMQQWNVLRFLRVIGYHSLYIYVMHVMIVAFSRNIFINVLHIHSAFVLLVLLIGAGVLIPIIFYNTVGRSKYGRFLFTYRNKEPATEKVTVRPEPRVIST